MGVRFARRLGSLRRFFNHTLQLDLHDIEFDSRKHRCLCAPAFLTHGNATLVLGDCRALTTLESKGNTLNVENRICQWCTIHERPIAERKRLRNYSRYRTDAHRDGSNAWQIVRWYVLLNNLNNPLRYGKFVHVLTLEVLPFLSQPLCR